MFAEGVNNPFSNQCMLIRLGKPKKGDYFMHCFSLKKAKVTSFFSNATQRVIGKYMEPHSGAVFCRRSDFS